VIDMDRKKMSVITFVLSLIPGLGHYYLGFNQSGLKFMIASFACISLIPAFPMVFPFALATIWFYQIFDALQKAAWLNKNRDLQESPVWTNPASMFKEIERERTVSSLWIGIGIIAAGVLVAIVTLFPHLREWILEPKNGSMLIAAVLILYGAALIVRHSLDKKGGPG
jgi:ABC-type Fe3+-siderophore transport system permease subunit